MKKFILEMPVVMQCTASECVYNVGSNCHARAITIGDSLFPACDTFLAELHRTKSVNQFAGIGACKFGTCKFNDDLECMTESIRVGMVERVRRGIIKNEANCLTFALR